MMLLSVAVALVAALCLVDLVLTLGVVRRLRDHSERLAQLLGTPFDDAPAARRAGEAVDDFSATTTTGETIALADLTEPTLVGFFAPDCPACEEKLPGFLSYAAGFPGGSRRTVAVIASESGGMKYRTALSEVAAVVVERERGPVQKAFGVSAYPAFLVVLDGVVVRSTHTTDDLPQHEPA